MTNFKGFKIQRGHVSFLLNKKYTIHVGSTGCLEMIEPYNTKQTP